MLRQFSPVEREERVDGAAAVRGGGGGIGGEFVGGDEVQNRGVRRLVVGMTEVEDGGELAEVPEVGPEAGGVGVCFEVVEARGWGWVWLC